MIIRINLADKRTEPLYRYALVRDILLFVGKDIEGEFTLTSLARGLGLQPNSSYLRKAIKVLVEAGLLVEKKAGKGRYVRINPDIMASPPNPYALIPQAEYREILMRIVARLKKLKIEKIILFGGVARGTADRLSDIDMLVVTKDPLKINSPVSGLMRECRTGKLTGERYGLNIKVIDNVELKNPRGFVKDALIEGIVLYNGD